MSAKLHYIGEWRRHKKMTQQQIADATGMTTVSVSRIETGARNPSLVVLHAVAAALGEHPARLLWPAPRYTMEEVVAKFSDLEDEGDALLKEWQELANAAARELSLVMAKYDETPIPDSEGSDSMVRDAK